MTATMKGLLKGLRYISQIFDNSDDDEPEMQIGNPTDVKHVAHIGWDGPAVNSPSWMNEFREPSESSSAPLNYPRGQNENGQNENHIPRRHSRDVFSQASADHAVARRLSLADDPSSPELERKQSRRRHSAGGSINSPGRDLYNGITPTRKNCNSNIGSPSPCNAPSPSIPKKSRRKKSKESGMNPDGSSKSGGGSTNEGSSKSGGGSSTGSSKSRLKSSKKSEPKSKDIDCPTSVLNALGTDEKKDYGGNPRQDLDL
ncbi:hypothetical protein IFM89_018050 [Coptis chinensis]|uniref:CRIB domain-containing protein n=1 Tax=Coptis chinensis TaxID=261450 RepID=A0A835LUR7_9MAGN|nr:hypothetical protein IFM89_018050 [Coptis chinensis]